MDKATFNPERYTRDYNKAEEMTQQGYRESDRDLLEDGQAIFNRLICTRCQAITAGVAFFDEDGHFVSELDAAGLLIEALQLHIDVLSGR